MAFWNRKTTEANVPKRRRISEARVLGTSPETGDFLRFGAANVGSPRSATQALALYDKSTAVSVPVGEVVSAFKQLMPILQFEDGSVEKQHPLLQLLKRPSPFFDQSLFMETMSTNYLVTGEAFVVAVGRENAPPIQLQPISPKNTVANLVSVSLVDAWLITDDIMMDKYTAEEQGALSVRYMDESRLKELQQIRNFSTQGNSMTRGQSPLVSASKEVRQHILGGTHNVSLLERGGNLSLVFHFEEDMDEDDFLETERRVNEEFGGAANAGRIATTAGPSLTVSEFGQKNTDMDFANLQKVIREVVSQVYHVPLPLVSTDALTFDNYSSAKVALYDDAVNPLAQRVYGGLGEMLLPRYGLDPSKVRIWYDPDMVPALKERRNSELKFRRELNVETINEFRSELGKDDVEDGDTLLVDGSLVPLGEDIFGDPGADIPDPVIPNTPAPPDDMADEEDDAE